MWDMITPENAKNHVSDIVARAIKAGADAADAIMVSSGSSTVHMRLGKLEDVERSEGSEIGLRVFIGQKVASVSGADFTSTAFDTLCERAVAMAKNSSADQYAGLAPEELLAKGDFDDLDLLDNTEVSPEELRARALASEEAARAMPGISNSEGASASAGQSTIAMATSHGITHSYSASRFGNSVMVLAGSQELGGMERDYAFRSMRYLSDLPDPEELGKLAATRALARVNPQKIKSGAMPVVFDPRVANSFIGHFLGAISGSSITRKTSFLLDMLGKQVFDSNISIIDNPHLKRGLASRNIDGEGLATAPSSLIDKGVLTGWMLDSASARQLGLQPTGHAARGITGAPGASPSNVHMAAGKQSPNELMADIKQGVYVTEMIGQGVNMITGDYSRGASGFIIENGELTKPVNEITIAGNLRDIFASLIAADDLEHFRTINAPTLRSDAMTVASG